MSNEGHLPPAPDELSSVAANPSDNRGTGTWDTQPSSVTLLKSQGNPRAVRCVACNAFNPDVNLHCEYCGARLPHRPSPHLPPRFDSSATRTLKTVAAGLVTIVVVVGLFLIAGRQEATPDLSSEAITEEAATESPVSLPAVADLGPVLPAGTTASSEHNGFPADKLIDGDPTSAWLDDSLGGQGAELTFIFDGSPRLLSVTLSGIQELDNFRRNFRIRTFEIQSGDSTSIVGELPDQPGPHTVQLPGWATNTIVLRVLTTYPSESTVQPGTQDLAVAEVEFSGQTSTDG